MNKRRVFGYLSTSILALWIGVSFAAPVPYHLVNPGNESGWNCDPSHGSECTEFSVAGATYDSSTSIFSIQLANGAQPVVFPPFSHNKSSVILSSPGNPNQISTIKLTYNSTDLTINCDIKTVTNNPKYAYKNPLYVLTGAVFGFTQSKR